MRYVSDDEALLRRVLGERLRLLAYLRSIVRRRDLAEDLFQDVCVLVLEKRDEVANVRELGPWLRKVARNLAMNAVRLHANKSLLLGDGIVELMEENWREVDAVARAGSDLNDALDSCLSHLGAPALTMLRARYTEGASVQDIAARMGRPINSLRTTFSRIHKKLAECILRKAALARARHA